MLRGSAPWQWPHDGAVLILANGPVPSRADGPVVPCRWSVAPFSSPALRVVHV